MGRKKREYTYDDWKKAIDLHHKYKLGYRRISRILGINENTVKNWLHYGKIPPTAKWIAKPCIELAYVIGSLEDGCVSKSESWYRYIIQLAVIDKEFGEVFSRSASRLLGVNYHKPWWSKKRRAWVVEYDSKAFYTWYKEREKQGLDGFKEYIEYSKETVKYYLKGLFDSEGNNYRNKQIHLSNSNKELLEYVQYLLEKYFNIKGTGPYLMDEAGSTRIINGIEYRYNYNYFMIVISRKEHVQNFLDEIGFSIVRKQLGLKRHEKVYVEGIGYVEPYRLVELGLFKLPFSDTQ